MMEDPDAQAPKPFVHWLISLPVGDPPHHYHFQVFALDTALSLSPGFTRTAALRAMNGHVLSRGEAVGLFSKP